MRAVFFFKILLYNLRNWQYFIKFVLHSILGAIKKCKTMTVIEKTIFERKETLVLKENKNDVEFEIRHWVKIRSFVSDEQIELVN